MAVYSYKTGTISPQLISFQTTEIGNFSSSALFDVVSQNNLFSLNSKTSFSQQRFSFSYNEFSTLYTLSEDYGLLFDGIAVISDYANSTIQEYANVEIENLLSPGSSIEDYGSIMNTPTEFESFGSVVDNNTPANGIVGNIESATKYSFVRAAEIQGTVFLFQGKSNYYINSSHIGYGSLLYSNGISSEKNTESYVGEGRSFGFGSKAERVVASYNNSSVVSYESANYGSITGGVATIGDYVNTPISTYSNVEIGSILSPESSTEDYGSVLDNPNLYTEREDYGLITGRGLRPFGLTSFYSSVVEKNTEDYVGSGYLFNFGTAKIFVLPIHYGKGTIKIRGAYSDLKNTESYVGTGRAFGFGSKAERTVVSYNESSVVDYVGTDYGSITGGVATIGDYANIPISTYSNVEIGSILSPESSTEDYGSIIDDPNLYTEREDYGLITGSGLRPFGLTSFHSSVIEKNTEDYVGSGSLFNFGTAKIFVLPIHYGRGVLKIRGAYSDLKNTESYVGSGSLFGFGSKAERTVVSYNESSVVDYEGLDYGSITGGVATIGDYSNETIITYSSVEIGSILSPESSTEDYGSVLDNPNLYTEREDYGLITGSGLRPFGLTRFSSANIEKNTENYVGSGKLFDFGTAEIFVLPSHVGRGVLKIRGAYSDLKNTESYVGTGRAFGFSSTTEAFGSKPPVSGLFRISGSLVEKNTEDYVGSGSLFNFGGIDSSLLFAYNGRGVLKIRGAYSDLKNTESYVGTGRAFGFGSKAERTTASYNLSSVVEFEGLDYGSITGGVATIGDYANTPISTYASTPINELLSPESSTEDYGSVLDNPNLYTEREDYGLITGSGLRPFGLTRFSSANIEKNTENYVGSGSLFIFVSKSETNTYSPTSIGLFKFSGSVVDKNTESYVGTGRAFGFGSKAERTTASYNESSVVDYVGTDYGSITGGVATIGDYANTPISTYSNVEIGSILSPESSTEDYGLIVDNELYGQETQDYGLITGRGLRPFGLTRFSGTRIEKNTESYFGSGSLFGFSSTTEVFGPKPPVSGLFRISGAATQSITPTTEIGSGTVIVRQASQILDAENKTRLVAAFESTGINEVGKPEAIKLSGEVGIYFQYFEDGSGTFKVRGRAVIRLKPIHIGGGSYFIRGAAAESTAPATEIGSGSLFTFVSKSESFGANPPENTALFKFTGSSISKNTESYVGIGLERINVESLILIRPRYPGSGSISVTSTYTENRRYVYTGLGNLFGFGSGTEYLTNAYKLDTFVIKIRGSAEESNTERFIGSGSIFSFESAVESKGSNPPENIALFKFGGSGSARTQPIYLGEGKLKFSEGSGRPDQNNKTFIISSDESSSIRTAEKPVRIKVSGSAITAKPSVYKGKGSLFGFSSASETAAFSPDDTRELFKISGSAIEKNTESFVGSGSVFSFVGTSYSSSKNTRGETNLFKINGSANESFGEGLYTGSGRLVTDLRSSTTVSFTPKITTTLFNFIGSSRERNTEAFSGSGSIGIFTNTAKSVFYNYKVSQKAFRIFGNTFESFARSNYYGFVSANIEGFSEDRKINYIPPKRVRIFII